MRNIACAVLALVTLCGCFKVKDELTIAPDGSGIVRMEVRASSGANMMGGMGGGVGSKEVFYPPINEAEARKFFPESQFKLTARQQRTPEGESVLTIEAAFKDINAMLASPYARAHGLTVTRTNGTLKLRAITGIEAVARAIDMKNDREMLGALNNPELEKQKQELRAEFRVTLPNDVSAVTADATKEAKSAVWIFERAKAKDGAEFAAKAGGILEASCADTGVAFTPSNQLRLAALAFAEVPEEAVQQGQAIDSAKVLAAAKFVPCALQVTRSLDLAGEDSGANENSAQLIGAVVLPQELAPNRWGEPKLVEAVDAKGTNLKPPANRSFSTRSFAIPEDSYLGMDDEDSGDEDAEGTIKPKERRGSPETKRMVTLTFQPPDWKVNEIARIKGTVSLEYHSGSQLLKISNAIPAKWIIEPSNQRNFFGGGDDGGKLVVSPKLADKGLKLKVPMAMAQSGGLMLNLSLEGEKSGMTDVQVFDAEGRPWPTYINRDGAGFGDERNYSVMIAGRPQPPLSLALMITGAGATVELPIGAEKVPVRKD